jgi:hypothetical protein
MCPTGRTPKHYKYLDEGEWRIVFSDDLEEKYYDSPDDIEDSAFEKYIDVAKQKPKYLLPLDKWFAFIIYPSLHVKVAAECDKVIRDEIERIKPALPNDQEIDCSKGTGSYETNSKPIEIDLDACRNF